MGIKQKIQIKLFTLNKTQTFLQAKQESSLFTLNRALSCLFLVKVFNFLLKKLSLSKSALFAKSLDCLEKFYQKLDILFSLFKARNRDKVFRLCYFFFAFSFLIVGCGQEDNKQLIYACNLIQNGKYKNDAEKSIIRSELQKVLAKDSKSPEALCPLKALDIIDGKADPKKASDEIASLIKPIEEEISRKTVDKDLMTDDDKEQLEKLNRKWNMSFEPAVMLLTSKTDWINSDSTLNLLVESMKVWNPELQQNVINLLVQIKSQSYSHLIKALQNSDPVIRRCALIALGKIGDETSIDQIKYLVNDNDAGVRFYVPIVLNSIGGEKALEPLHLALKDEISHVRVMTANIIGKLKDETALDILIELLADDNSYVVSRASDAIKRIGKASIPKLVEVLETKAVNIKLSPSNFSGEKVGDLYQKELSKRTNIQSSVISILGNMKDVSSINKLLEVMKTEVPASASEFEKTNAASIRLSAVTALTTIGEPAVVPLINIVENSGESEIARVNAGSILSAIGDRRAVVPLINALKDENKNVRASSATALGLIKDRRALNPLIEALKDTDIVVKTNVATSLGLLADKAATQALIALVKDDMEREKTRTVAMDSLGLIKDPLALDTFLEVLINEYEKDGIRKSAANALRLSENIYASEALISLLKGEIVQGIYMPRNGKITGWLKNEKDKDIVKDITPLFEFTTGTLKTTVTAPSSGSLIKIYVKGGESAEANTLVGLISFKDREIKEEERSSIRNMASSALGKVKGDNAVPALVTALRKDKNGAVRKNAASSLREIENANARSALIKALDNDDSGVVRSEAAYALGVGAIKHADCVEPLIKAMRKDKYESARVWAAWSLGEIADKRAVDPLIDAIVIGRKKGEKESPAVIAQAVTALDKIAGAAVQPLVDVIKDKDIDEVPRSKAAATLGLIENTDAVEPLIAVLKDESVVVRSESARSLGLIGDRRAVEPLIGTLNDPNEWITVHTRAIESLGKIKDERAVIPLLDALKSSIQDIKNISITAFSLIKDRRSVPQLIQIVENEKEDDAIRINGISSLSIIADARAIPTLMTALANSDININQNAATALGTIAAKEAVGPLMSIMKNQNEQMVLRANAAEALGKIGDRSVNSTIAERVADSNESDTVWIKLAEAAGKLRANLMTDLAFVRAKDALEPVTVRTSAIMALSGTGKGDDFSLILELLNDGTVAIRSAAALALGNSGNKAAIPPLIEKLQKDAEEVVRRDSAKALAALADLSSEQALIKAFQEDATASVKNESALALGNIKGKSGIAALISVVQDSSKANDHRWNSATALGNAGSTEAVAALTSTLESNLGNIHFESAEALRKIIGRSYGYER